MSDYTPEQTLREIGARGGRCRPEGWLLDGPVEIHGQTVEGRPITGSYAELRHETGETVGWIAAEFPGAAEYIETIPPPIGYWMARTIGALGLYLEAQARCADGPEHVEMLRESYERLRDALLFRFG